MEFAGIMRHNRLFSPVWAILGALAIAFAPVPQALAPRLLPDVDSSLGITLGAILCVALVAAVWWAVGRGMARFIAGARRPWWAAVTTGGVAGAVGTPLGALASQWSSRGSLPEGVLPWSVAIGFVVGIILARLSPSTAAA